MLARLPASARICNTLLPVLSYWLVTSPVSREVLALLSFLNAAKRCSDSSGLG